MSLTKKQLSAFSALQAAILASEQGFVFAKASDVEVFASTGMIETNSAITNDSGEIAVRLPQASGETSETKQASGKVGYAIVSDVEMPKSTRGAGAGRQASYPFDSMDKGQSFFVPATAAKPHPAKSLASTVTSANARYSEVIEGTRKNRKGVEVPNTRQTREFAVRAIEDGEKWGYPGTKGAAVWRTL